MEESKRNDRGAETARVRLEIKRVEKYSVYSVELSRGSSGIQRDGIFTGRRPHAYETTAVAKAGPAMRLIRRCFVIVVGKFRLARRRVHADRVADQNYTLAALAQLRASGSSSRYSCKDQASHFFLRFPSENTPRRVFLFFARTRTTKSPSNRFRRDSFLLSGGKGS